jgi:pyridoxamine 5'-phosphate oxidase-like protein
MPRALHVALCPRYRCTMKASDAGSELTPEADLKTPQPGPIQAPSGYRFPKTGVGMLNWTDTELRLRRSRYYWLTTNRPDGRPHATPLWGVWLQGALFFDGRATTRWARNLGANPNACVHLESGCDVVILEGVVDEFVTDLALGERLVEAWHRKYGRLVPSPAADGVFRFRPRNARAWSTETLEDGTRWRFVGSDDPGR